MKSLIKNLLFIVVFSINSFALYAANDNTRVIQWAQKTLMDTLSVSYTSKPQDFATVRKNYTLDAWSGMTGFLGGNMKDIREKQLTLHPVLLPDTQILSTGLYSGIRYWVVKQSIAIDELNTKLTFTLTILGRSGAAGSPYIVQSLSILLNAL
ncbi:hypothetical protein SCJ60_12650 [Legionella pneumophila serogroup 9]